MKTTQIIQVQTYASPCGEILLGSLDGQLCWCDWVEAAHWDTTRRRADCRTEEGASAVTAQATKELDEYFAGRRQQFDVPLCPLGTDFQREVWEALRQIPYGVTLTYGEVACRLHRSQSVRAVANAIGANALALFIPCHRVVGAGGKLTGFSGGLAVKRYLLDWEQKEKQMPNCQ